MCNMNNKHKLIYVHDPMCSWCWGFRETFIAFKQAYGAHFYIEKVVGGLAADSAEPMDTGLREQLEHTWRVVAQKTGAQFNHDFWRQCTPRRSTYMSCRAVIIAGDFDLYDAMIEAIQFGYYRHAQNPSEVTTLVQLASNLGMDSTDFENKLLSPETDERLQAQIRYARSIGGNHFPSLFVEQEERTTEIAVNYTSHQQLYDRIMASIATH